MKKCPFCGAELNDDSLFCTECGKELPMGVVCPHCGASVNEGDVFCTECGKRIDKVPQATSSEPTKPKCPHCGALINEGYVFCMECGKKVDEIQAGKTDEVVTTKKCPHCGATMREDARFCPNCDKYVNNESSETASEAPQTEEETQDFNYSYVEEEPKTWRDYKLPIFGGIFIVLFLSAGWWYYDSSNKRVAMEKAIADSLEAVRQDSLKKAAEKEKERLEADRITTMRKVLSPEHVFALMSDINNTSLANKSGLEEIYKYKYESEEDEDGFVDRLSIIIYGREVGKGSVSENGLDVNYQIKSNSEHSCYLEYYERSDYGYKIAFKDKEDADYFYNKILENGVFNYGESILIPKKKDFSGIRKIENFDIEDISFGMSDVQLSEGWYVIHFNPY